MAKMLRCRDVGPDCDFTARAETEAELLRQVAEHARTVHGIDPIPPELAQTVQACIRSEP